MFVSLSKIRSISVFSALFVYLFLCHTLAAQEKQAIGTTSAVVKKATISKNPVAVANSSPQPVQYSVGRRETLYSIAKRFNTTQEQILLLNPSLHGILKKGTILTLPGSPGLSSALSETVVQKPFIEYKIVKGDNYFQIEKRFGVSQTELEQLNPILKDGLKSAMIIKIPIKDSPDASSGINGSTLSNKEKTPSGNVTNDVPGKPDIDLNKLFEVGIFLPFCENLNDSARIDQHANSFLEFYCGILLATQKLTESGMKVKLCVYDTYHDSSVVEQLVKQPEFLSLDLIIGPVYPEDQKMITELSGKNHIPIVSPLSSDSRYVSTTPGYYLINPGRKVRLAGTADYISTKFAGQNIIMLNHGSDSEDEKFIFDRLNQNPGGDKIRQYNVLTEGTAGLEALLQTGKENIIILTETNEANVSVAMTRLNTISKLNSIKVIGLQEYTKMQSIDIEHLHNTNLHYLAPYFIDYRNPKVNAFIEKYRSSFGSEPTPYSFHGYDVALHFIALLGRSGKNFPATDSNSGVELLQAGYRFQKLTDFGGYINRTLNVIEYTKSYEVRSVEKILGKIASDHGEGKEDDKNVLEQ
jgi:LysM repeat protein/ABC-type branched-subunit amino acid transport system substrate-binding protein